MTIKNHFLLGRILENEPATGSISFSNMFNEKLFLLLIKFAHEDQLFNSLFASLSRISSLFTLFSLELFML